MRGMHRTLRAWPRQIWLGVLLPPLLLLAACGGGTGGSGGSGSTPTPTTSSHPQLACTLATSAEGVDVIKHVLSCTVTGAPAGETGFTLSYHAVNGAGQETLLAPACTGILTDGSGSCTQTYNTIAPTGSGPGSVTGVTEPHHERLGTVVPKQVQGTPGSQNLPTSPGSPMQ